MGVNYIKIRCYKEDYYILYEHYLSFLIECTKLLKKFEKKRKNHEKKKLQKQQTPG